MGLGAQDLLQAAVVLERDEPKALGVLGVGVPHDDKVGNFPELAEEVA